MGSPPTLTAHVVAVVWTAESGVPLAAAVCAAETIALPADVLDLDTTSLFRFLTGMQRSMTASPPSSPAQGPPRVLTASLPRAASQGTLLVGSGTVAHEASTAPPLLRVAVLLAVPPTVQADSAPASTLTCRVVQQAVEAEQRARVVQLTRAALNGLEAGLAAHGGQGDALAEADATASAQAAAYTAQSAKACGSVSLQSWLAATEAAQGRAGTAENTDAHGVGLPPALWLSVMESIRTAGPASAV